MCVFVHVCVCVCVDALCRSLQKSKVFSEPAWCHRWEQLSVGQSSVSHGRAPHAGDGGCGGFGQPARLDPGPSDPEEVVQPGADAVQALLGSVVRDWKMLPGMSVFFSHISTNSPIRGVGRSFRGTSVCVVVLLYLYYNS